jgi:hypothetical protein
MKVRTVITSVAALALIVPAIAQARPDNGFVGSTPTGSSQIDAIKARSEGLNRLYHLGAYSQSNAAVVRALTLRGQALNRMYNLGTSAPSTRFLSDVASSNEVARTNATIDRPTLFLSDVASSNEVARTNATTDRSDVLTRYVTNLDSGQPQSSVFSSDVANSDAVARYQANATRDTTQVTSGNDGILRSPATDAGIAAGLLLIAAAGFAIARTRHHPVRPA